jgi:hypothetical protein
MSTLKLGRFYDVMMAQHPAIMNAALDTLRMHGWSGQQKPDMALMSETVDAVFAAMMGAGPGEVEEVAIFEARDWTAVEQGAVISAFAMLTPNPQAVRVTEVILADQGIHEPFKFIYFMDVYNALSTMAIALYGEGQWLPYIKDYSRQLDAMIKLDDVAAFREWDEVLELAPFSYEFANMMVTLLTEGREDLEGLSGQEILEAYVPTVLEAIQSGNAETLYDGFPISDVDAHKLFFEARSLLGPVLAEFIRGNYEFEFESMQATRTFLALYLVILVSAAHDKGWDYDGNVLIDTLYLNHNKAMDTFQENAGLSLAIMRLLGLDQAIEVEVGDLDAVRELIGDGGLNAGTRVTVMTEFPELDNHAKAALLEEIQAFQDKFLYVKDYDPLEDEAYGRTLNQRRLNLLKMQIIAVLNGFNIQWDMAMPDMIHLYILLKIKENMKQGDAYSDLVVKLESDLLAGKENYEAIAAFVDTHFQEYRKLVPRI